MTHVGSLLLTLRGDQKQCQQCRISYGEKCVTAGQAGRCVLVENVTDANRLSTQPKSHLFAESCNFNNLAYKR